MAARTHPEPAVDEVEVLVVRGVKHFRAQSEEGVRNLRRRFASALLLVSEIAIATHPNSGAIVDGDAVQRRHQKLLNNTELRSFS